MEWRYHIWISIIERDIWMRRGRRVNSSNSKWSLNDWIGLITYCMTTRSTYTVDSRPKTHCDNYSLCLFCFCILHSVSPIFSFKLFDAADTGKPVTCHSLISAVMSILRQVGRSFVFTALVLFCIRVLARRYAALLCSQIDWFCKKDINALFE